jgi:amino acid adenylation domain-containing protein
MISKSLNGRDLPSSVKLGSAQLCFECRNDGATGSTVTENIPSIGEQIETLSAAFPNSIALSHGDRRMTYAELDRRAKRFAGYLSQCGVVPDGTVAICMERSFDWIVAALGVIRAGAAYVPLDPAWPDSRLRFATEDCGATVLIGRVALLDRLQVEVRGVDLCRDSAAIAATPELPTGLVQPESLAYVIYTSGSTGVPKGVEITHANLNHLIRWHLDAFGVTRQDRASHLAGLGYDAAVWEIWPNLAAGATVCLVDETVRSSPDLLQKWMIREGVTIGFVPTVNAGPMMAMEWPAATCLRFLLTGGDALHRGPSVQLPFEVINNYGPTECTVVATSAVLKPGAQREPSIGCSIIGTTVYLLSEIGEPVPEGSVGELYIGGGGVGRGYRNLPDLTDRNFLPDPFARERGARMYRTGDLGVRRPDGEIEFRGRLDRQTKIRGQRVELDEIGSILQQHPSVDYATATTNVLREGENQLVAYVLPKENVRVPTVRELQEFLLRSLPGYMIPTIFVRLRAVPISANGKIDLLLLPLPTEANLLPIEPAKSSASPLEEKLLTMVRGILENDAVSAIDSFFSMGGHSLLGMQLLMRLRNTFGVDLTLRELFEGPTVERLALLVETKIGEKRLAASAIPALPPGVLAFQPEGARDNIFWIYYLSAELSKALGEDQPLLFVVPTEADLVSLGDKPTLQSFAACLVRKILAAQPNGPYTIGGLCLGGILAYEIAFQLGTAGHQVSLVVVVDSPNPSYLQSCDSLTSKIRYVAYAVKRAARLGLRMSLFHLRQHLAKPPAMKIALQAAALAYRPEQYEGKVLLLLASERPPHVNFLPGWRAVVPGNLHTQYVAGHRSELLVKNVQIVADAIATHLPSTTTEPCTCSAALTSTDSAMLSHGLTPALTRPSE